MLRAELAVIFVFDAKLSQVAHQTQPETFQITHFQNFAPPRKIL